MPRALVLDRDPGDRRFFAEVLREHGYDVETTDGAAWPAEAFDLLLADADLALGSEAVRAHGSRVVLTSPFAALLEPFRTSSFGILHKPATREDVARALAGAPAKLPEPFDWTLHEARAGIAIESLRAARDDIAHLPELVATSLRATAMVNVVLSGEQRFVAHTPLPVDLEAAGGTPRAWSLCQHVVAAGVPMIVRDARVHPSLEENPLVRVGLLRAYAGVPVRVAGVGVVGTVCVLSDRARDFSEADIAALRLAAEAVGARLRQHDVSAQRRVRDQVRNEARDPSTVDVPAVALDDAADMIGEVLNGRYVVTAPLGSGGMSHVYLARDATIGNLVAVKVLRDELAQGLIEEARAIASVRHPNIVQLHGWGRTRNGSVYLVLEYVAGQSLRDAVMGARDRPPLRDVLRILREVSGALETLHAAGYVHGDVKPANLILDRELDRVVLVDFGLAMRLPTGSRSPSGSWDAWSPSDARSGGTPGYSAPEQLRQGETVTATPQLDVHALGALAYFLLVGRGPFARIGSDRGEALESRFVPVDALRDDLAASVQVELARALSPDPRERHRSPSAFVDRLEDALMGRSPRPRGRERAGASTSGESFLRVRGVAAEVIGVERERKIAARLPPIERDAWYSASLFIEYLRAYSSVAPIDTLASGVFRALGARYAARLRIDRSPVTLVRSVDGLLQRFHDEWMRMEVHPRATNALAVRIDAPEAMLPEACTYFGGLARAAIESVRVDVTTRHASCRARGDATCEVDLRWAP